MYIEHVHKGKDPDVRDKLMLSTEASTVKTYTTFGPRWSGQVEVTSGHILPWEFGFDPHDEAMIMTGYGRPHHDLNWVLERFRV
jgi:hypothetical protein